MQSTPRLHGKSNLYLPDNLSTSPNLRVDSHWYLFLSLGRIDREVMNEGTSHTIYPSRGRPQDHKGCVHQCVLVHVDEQEGVLHPKTTFFWHFYTQTPFTSAPQAPQHSDKLICHDLNPSSPFRNMRTIPYYPTVSAPVCPPILSDCINYCYFTTI